MDGREGGSVSIAPDGVGVDVVVVVDVATGIASARERDYKTRESRR